VPDFRLPEEDIFLPGHRKPSHFFPPIEYLYGGEVFPRNSPQFYDSAAKNLQLAIAVLRE